MSNENCYSNTCERQCCNSYGYCPEDYSHSEDESLMSCYYYYYDDGSSGIGAYIGFMIAPIVFILICVICVILSRRRRMQLQGQNQIAMQMSNPNNETYIINNGQVPNYNTSSPGYQNNNVVNYPPNYNNPSNYAAGNYGVPNYGGGPIHNAPNNGAPPYLQQSPVVN